MRWLKVLHSKDMVKEYYALGIFIVAANTFFPGELRQIWQQYWLYMVSGTWGIVGVMLWAFTRSRTVEERLMEVIKNLEINIKIGKEEIQWPKVIKRTKEEYGWEFVLFIPPGLWWADFIKYRGEFETALNAECEIFELDGKIHFKVMSHVLPKETKFKKEWVEDDSTAGEE